MTVTIAHLSDVHLGPIVGFSPKYWNAKRLLGFANWHRNRRKAFQRPVLDRLVADMLAQQPDHIAVTGDLVNIGLPGEMDQALAWLESIGPPARVAVIPGNHDIYTTMRGDRGIDRWTDYMRGDDPAGEHAFPYVRRIGRVALVGANSAIETPPFVASGRLGSAQRKRIAATLEALRAEDRFRLLMIHHPPLPGQALPRKALRDARQVRMLLERHGAELVIHGHNHRAMSTRLGGREVPVIGVPAASMAARHGREPLARYNIYRITGSPSGGWRIRMTSRGLHEPSGSVEAIEDMDLSASAPSPS